MAEFTEVWKQWTRMCKAHENCEDCPLRSLGCNLEFPCNQTKYAPDLIERIVMEWAAAHPEKVYPTWREWLNMQAVVWDFSVSGWIATYGKIDKPIPADIAEKLGLEPKEG